MKNKIFALSLCAMFLFAGFAQAAPVFTDVPADRAEAPAIELMQALGIMQGVSEGQFAPEESLTRAQFAAISLELSGVAAADMDLEDPVFTDVDSSYWAAGAIQTAA